jgi:hypothetical protein
MGTNKVNKSPRRTDINWRHVRREYETTSVGLGTLAKRLGCSKSIVARRYYRELWQKDIGVPYDKRATGWNKAMLQLSPPSQRGMLGLDYLTGR